MSTYLILTRTRCIHLLESHEDQIYDNIYGLRAKQTNIDILLLQTTPMSTFLTLKWTKPMLYYLNIGQIKAMSTYPLSIKTLEFALKESRNRRYAVNASKLFLIKTVPIISVGKDDQICFIF